jgi:hypothetical protein
MYKGRNVGVRDGQGEFPWFMSWQNFAQFGRVIFVSCEKREKEKKKKKNLCKIHKVHANSICVYFA